MYSNTYTENTRVDYNEVQCYKGFESGGQMCACLSLMSFVNCYSNKMMTKVTSYKPHSEGAGRGLGCT